MFKFFSTRVQKTIKMSMVFYVLQIKVSDNDYNNNSNIINNSKCAISVMLTNALAWIIL